MKNRIVLFACLLLLTGLLVGCSVSVDDEIKNTTAKIEEAFNNKPMETNKSFESISYYLPNAMKIESEGTNNLIFEQGKQLYILFVNPNEELDSKVMFESTGAKTKKDLVFETFEDENRFGYVKVTEVEENSYEVLVGIGGIKLTTQAKASQISESAEQMMQIVSSVKYQ